MLIVIYIFEPKALIWRHALQAGPVGIDAMPLRDSGCVRPSALQGQDHKSPSYHGAGLGDVFTQDVLDTRLEHNREREVDAMRLRPHPREFALFYDV